MIMLIYSSSSSSACRRGLISFWATLGGRVRSSRVTYVVSLLLILVSLLVGGSLGLVGSTLLLVKSLPALSEELSDLTEGNTRVLLANVLTLLVGEEHVGRETTLGRVGVYGT